MRRFRWASDLKIYFCPLRWAAGLASLFLFGVLFISQPAYSVDESSAAYKAYLKEQKAANEARLSGLEEYRKKKAKAQREREKARSQYQRKDKVDKSAAFERHLKKQKKRLKAREAREKKFAAQHEKKKLGDQPRPAYHDINGVVVKDRERVDHSMRELYTGDGSSSSAARPSSARQSRFQMRDQSRTSRFSDRRDEAREDNDRFRQDNAAAAERLRNEARSSGFDEGAPPPPPPNIDEPPMPPPAYQDEPIDEPVYEDEYMEDPGDINGEDFPVPPPPDFEGDY